jgi:hypothetical protein
VEVAQAALLIFSMGAAGGGALLRSASLEGHLQRHRYQIKDWRCSPVATVCDFHFVEMAAAACCDFVVIEKNEKGRLLRGLICFALPLPVGDALCRWNWRRQRC